MRGNLSKMRTELAEQVQYFLPIGEHSLHLNPFIGSNIAFRYTGQINCTHCGRKTKKSYSQGYCYVCMKKLAQCDMCIMKPETCHFEAGTCREPQWGEDHCFIPHYVYLANTSGLKVGITRNNQLPTRWLDQGASQAMPLLRVSSRLLSGLLEVALSEHINDKTNWRALLKGEASAVDLTQAAQELLPLLQSHIDALRLRFGQDAIEVLPHTPNEVQSITYPVCQYPSKISSFNLDKAPLVEGKLEGIKGQYLLLDTGVINMRKYTGYEIEWLSA